MRKLVPKMRTPMLEVTNFSAGYGRMEIVHDICFSIGREEILAILGPNGAGKSTIFKAFFGLANRHSGTVRYKGRDITKWSPPRILAEGLVYLPQGHSIFPAMTVRENLEMGAYIRKEGVAELVDKAMADFPLLRRKEKSLAGELSGGQQKILELARAMLLSPTLLLVDEPSAGLAPRIVVDVIGNLSRLREKGLSIIIIEQAADVALRIANRAIVLKTGTIAFDGLPEELLHGETVREIIFGRVTEDEDFVET